MKYLILLLSIVFTCAHGIHLIPGIKPHKFPPVGPSKDLTPHINWEKLEAIVEKVDKQQEIGAVDVNITDYALEILHNVASFIVRKGYDPMELSDEYLNLLVGSLSLNNGWLQDLSTVTFSDDVIVKYSRDSKILDLTLPLAFKTLLIDYDYKATAVLIFSLTGTVNAKVSDLKLDLHMGFNFSEYHAFVDNLDVKNSGKIDLTFTGLGLLDWIIDMMSSALTTLFHTLILSIADLVIYIPVQSVVNAINDGIDGLLHPNSTTFYIN